MPDRLGDEQVRGLLERPRTVAIVGMSPSPDRPSRQIGFYLLQRGFTIIPVHPTAREIAGVSVFERLELAPRDPPIDIVDVCVAAERAGPIAEAAKQVGAKVLWFQPGAENPVEEQRGRELGLEVISGRCIMADHRRLIG